MKTEFPDKRKNTTKKIAHPYENFNSNDDHPNPVDNLKKEDFSKKLKNDYPSVKENERTKEIVELFDNKRGKKLTQLYIRNDVLLLACVFEKFIKLPINEFGINPLY